MSPHESVDPKRGGREKPADVPVFSCIVLVSPEVGGGVRARVANLAGFECTAASERQALAQIISTFKQRVAELIRAGTPIPWIDPPLPAEPHEQKRWVPVHL
jgi:hypothetical protein